MSLGYFGKLPDRGDFVSRGVTPELEGAVHRFGSALIAGGQDRYKEQFADVFAQMPLHALLAAERVLTNATVIGLFGPSTDAVGRLFPLFVLKEGPSRSEEKGADAFTSIAKIVDDAAFEKTPLEEFEERLASTDLFLNEDDKGLVLSQWSTSGPLTKRFQFACLDDACSEAWQILPHVQGST